MAEPTPPVVELDRPRAIHLVGVGGAGISAIGVILATMGHRVTGADVRETPAWPALAAAGVTAIVAAPDRLFDAPDGTEVVAHSTAFPPRAAVQQAAADAGIVLTNRAGILAAICAARPTVAVSGTHGKTSTTAMLATLLDGAGRDPSYLVGAVPVGLGRSARWSTTGAGPFVVEADESDGSFLELGATTAVVTNIDEDHLDHWGTLDAIEAGFDRFLADAQRGVVCIDDVRAAGTAETRATRVAEARRAVTVGEAATAAYRIDAVAVDRLTTRFRLHAPAGEAMVEVGTPGRHHARNAAVAVATAVELGVPLADAVAAVGAYRGVSRRFEVIGEAAGVTVVDDYAHNPGKVHALITSAREAGWDRVVVIFQPQRYTRTRDQGADLGAALADAHPDVLAVTDIYPAGEDPVAGVTGRLVLGAALDARPWMATAWVPTLADARRWAVATLRPGDLCLTVGAGDIHTIGRPILDALGAAPAGERR